MCGILQSLPIDRLCYHTIIIELIKALTDKMLVIRVSSSPSNVEMLLTIVKFLNLSCLTLNFVEVIGTRLSLKGSGIPEVKN